MKLSFERQKYRHLSFENVNYVDLDSENLNYKQELQLRGTRLRDT